MVELSILTSELVFEDQLIIGLVSALSGVLVSFLVPFFVETIKAVIKNFRSKSNRRKYCASKIYEWVIDEINFLNELSIADQDASKWFATSKERILKLQKEYIDAFDFSWYEIGFVFSIFDYEEVVKASKKFSIYFEFLEIKKKNIYSILHNTRR